MSIHFNRWGEALWVEGVSPGPHEFNEGCPREFLSWSSTVQELKVPL